MAEPQAKVPRASSPRSSLAATGADLLGRMAGAQQRCALLQAKLAPIQSLDLEVAELCSAPPGPTTPLRGWVIIFWGHVTHGWLAMG
jgi:hypothetical protein